MYFILHNETKKEKKNYKIGLNNLGEEIEPVAFIVGILKSIHTIWPSTIHCVTSIMEQNHPTKNIYKKKKKPLRIQKL